MASSLFKAEELAKHAAALVDKLTDTDGDAREAAQGWRERRGLQRVSVSIE